MKKLVIAGVLGLTAITAQAGDSIKAPHPDIEVKTFNGYSSCMEVSRELWKAPPGTGALLKAADYFNVYGDSWIKNSKGQLISFHCGSPKYFRGQTPAHALVAPQSVIKAQYNVETQSQHDKILEKQNRVKNSGLL